MQTNWAGNHVYRAERIASPTSLEQLQELVAGHERVRALGSRHSFTDLADTDGLLVSLDRLPHTIEIDEVNRQVTVGAAIRYGDLAADLHQRGWALANLASLPHICVGGAIATGTHGSGNRVGSLAAAVAAVEMLGPDGQPRRLSRGDEAFDGSVVALGALGVMTRVTLDLEPTFELSQVVFRDLELDAALARFDEITSSAYSVSLFTDWVSERAHVWLKSRGPAAAPDTLAGATRADRAFHMLSGAPVAAITEQGGVLGPWHERLPHFRMTHTPSRGEELQSEYLLPRHHVAEAFTALRALADRMAPLLQVCEIRTVCADQLWLSSSHGHDTVGFHFTWVLDPQAVYALLPAIEDALLPIGARPHWGKCFAADAEQVATLYPRWQDFANLRQQVDPGRKFGNAWLERVIG